MPGSDFYIIQNGKTLLIKILLQQNIINIIISKNVLVTFE